jgi:hypothetical protein
MAYDGRPESLLLPLPRTGIDVPVRELLTFAGTTGNR